MRRLVVTLLALVSLAVAAVPAAASSSGTSNRASGASDGWEPAPTPPLDWAAGERCDFAVHLEPVVDEVVQKVLSTYADGSTEWIAFKGDLIVRVTNTETGAFHDADASGKAIVHLRTDGSQFWSVVGPAIVTFAENGGTLPRGIYRLDGVYTMDVTATAHKTVDFLHNGSADGLCERID
jgi:hypothetical protein